MMLCQPTIIMMTNLPSPPAYLGESNPHPQQDNVSETITSDSVVEEYMMKNLPAGSVRDLVGFDERVSCRRI